MSDAKPEEKGNFVEQIRRVALAGVGAIVMAQEEMAEFVHRLIERGEIGEQDGRNVISDILSRKTPVHSIESQINARFGHILKSLHLPTASDVQALNERLDAIREKLGPR